MNVSTDFTLTPETTEQQVFDYVAMRYTKESAAWWAIAARLETPGAEVGGLCHEVYRLHSVASVPWDLRQKMDMRITAHLHLDETALLWENDTTPAPRVSARIWLTRRGEIGPRIIAATLLALECEAEEAGA